MAEDKVKTHFDNIAESYKDEIANHIRDHLINKWWDIVKDYFKLDSRVIDIGCGDGTNMAFLKSKGINIIGLDSSKGLIMTGIERHPGLKDALFEGDALNLHFPDNAFDVAVMIGVLHHIHSRNDQIAAIQEAFRVVKNNGVIIIRECNLINPVFRVFWNYIFPLIAKIDRFGGEKWISAKKISDVFSGTVEKIGYFTFIPNFTPSFLLPIAMKVEGFLEKSFFKRLSAHYVVIMRKGKGL